MPASASLATIAAGDPAARIEALAEAFAATAIERDRRGGSAEHERGLLRASGLLDWAVPHAYGGPQGDWREILAGVRRLAQVDSSLAHLFAFQHLQVATVLLYGTAAQRERYLRATVEEGWFWGNALNPLGRNAVARPHAGGWRINGCTRFCSGAKGSDRLIVSLWPQDSEGSLVAVLPSTRAGIRIRDDWDNMGQRQTDSGSVDFTEVDVAADEVLGPPGAQGSVRATLRPCLAQLILVTLYTGIAEGAFAAALGHARTARPWPQAGVEQATREPFRLHRLGGLGAGLRAAQVLQARAVVAFAEAWARGEALSAGERGELAVTIAEAKVIATQHGLELTSALFDAAGASATAARYGLDRYWRNLRTHSLHDPLDYKLQALGDWYLNGRAPQPGSYA